MPRKVVPQLQTVPTQSAPQMQFVPAPSVAQQHYPPPPYGGAWPVWPGIGPNWDPSRQMPFCGPMTGQWVPAAQAPMAQPIQEQPQKPPKTKRVNDGAKVYRAMVAEASALGIPIADPERPGKWLKTAALKEKLLAHKEDAAALEAQSKALAAAEVVEEAKK